MFLSPREFFEGWMGMQMISFCSDLIILNATIIGVQPVSIFHWLNVEKSQNPGQKEVSMSKFQLQKTKKLQVKFSIKPSCNFHMTWALKCSKFDLNTFHTFIVDKNCTSNHECMHENGHPRPNVNPSSTLNTHLQKMSQTRVDSHRIPSPKSQV